MWSSLLVWIRIQEFPNIVRLHLPCYIQGRSEGLNIGGCRDLDLPTDLVMVTGMGEGSKGRGVPSPLDIFMICK